MARIGVVSFPGSLDDAQAARAVTLAGGHPVRIWHADTELDGVDAVVLPGGSSYGDYLRPGALAAVAPIIAAIRAAAAGGMPVLGVGNGFQILCEAGLLPGALVANPTSTFRCLDARLRVESTTTAWTGAYTVGQRITLPVKNTHGRYVADENTVDHLQQTGSVVLRYEDGTATTIGHSGPASGIAGIADERGRVVGMMPHPEHAVEPGFGPSTDGLDVFASALASLLETV
ncbi:MAG TPA: phosphoribosylformylglycinamidine synthase subunit PurQ [Beutenbergiaceae bacterium]|nr:phosphoribosylformylglycinamidine synthase subunit PurQ [Beutenbergiaceae bacterium]